MLFANSSCTFEKRSPAPSPDYSLLQYADELLLASPSKDACIKDILHLLTHLANKGHRASLSKMQYCQEHVQYLGHMLHNSTRQLSPK